MIILFRTDTLPGGLTADGVGQLPFRRKGVVLLILMPQAQPTGGCMQ